MQNCVRAKVAYNFYEAFRVSYVQVHDVEQLPGQSLNPPQRIRGAVAEIVYNTDLMTSRQQLNQRVASDIPCTTCYKYPQVFLPLKPPFESFVRPQE